MLVSHSWNCVNSAGNAKSAIYVYYVSCIEKKNVQLSGSGKVKIYELEIKYSLIRHWNNWWFESETHLPRTSEEVHLLSVDRILILISASMKEEGFELTRL